ncbi:MAG TPA: BPL-N domain-containing protein [Methanobacterium sp.]|nr:BPL-N domain-containing protein [Methanobacterium sp.]
MGIISAADVRENTANNSNHYSVNSFTSNSTGTYEGTSTPTTTTQEIKVLIYNGEYSIGVCVTGIKKGLDSANTNNLVPGYHFTYATSTTITSTKLSGYDVLAMPGGADGDYYVYSSSISASAIKNFVSSGHGYLGICAGAYSGVKAVKGYYNAWGVAPHVVATRPWVEGNVPIKIEPAGQALFGYGGNITMAHYNGPAMFASGGDIVTFATYADNKCYSKGLGAIVGDFYGKGRSVIVGPHPELDPKYPDILAKLVVWSANKSSLQSSLIYKASLAQISTAAATVKAYYEANKTLPGKVTVDGYNFTMPQLLYLMGSGILKINGGYNSDITIRPVGYAPAPSGTYKSGSISMTSYVSYAKTLVSFINSNGRAPNFQTTTLGKINYTKLVYMYSKILYYYNQNNKLPSSVAI